MSASVPPPFAGNISFNAKHAPFGPFFSFACGHFGTRGGFGVQIGKPGNQDLYIGVKEGDRFADGPLRVLPFYEGATANEAARYDVEREAGPAEQNLRAQAGPDGVLPAVFEHDNPGHGSRILPAAEGWIYPLASGRTCAEHGKRLLSLDTVEAR